MSFFFTHACDFNLYYIIYYIFLHRFLYSIYASTLMVIHNIQCCSLIRLWVQSTIHIRSLQVLTELREWLYAWLARSTTGCLANNTSDLLSMGELPSLSRSVWVPVGLCFWGQCWLPRVMDQVTESHARLERPWVWRWVWHWKRRKSKGKSPWPSRQTTQRKVKEKMQHSTVSDVRGKVFCFLLSSLVCLRVYPLA